MEYLLITRKGNEITTRETTREIVERVAITYSVAYNLDISKFRKKFRNNEECAFSYNTGDFEIAVVAK